MTMRRAMGLAVLLTICAPALAGPGWAQWDGPRKPKTRPFAVYFSPAVNVAKLRSGDRIDVLMSHVIRETNERATETILENILVLSAGAIHDGPNGRPTRVDIELTVKQAEAITVARALGKLSFKVKRGAHAAASSDGSAR